MGNADGNGDREEKEPQACAHNRDSLDLLQTYTEDHVRFSGLTDGR
jgi:hypothetical protein